MTSREDFGRLAHAAYCDMAGRPAVWEALGPRAQAGWMHAAVTVRDRLQLGIAHAYRPDDRSQRQEESAMALAKSTAHGGSEEPHVTETDDAEVYERQRAAGNTEIKWTGPKEDAPAGAEVDEPKTDEPKADAPATPPGFTPDSETKPTKPASTRGGSKR